MGNTVNVKKPRPVNLDLQTIRFPVTAIASILHRVSGVITFISVGILLWLLSLSLSSINGFQTAADIVDSFFVKFVLWGIMTASFIISLVVFVISSWIWVTLKKSNPATKALSCRSQLPVFFLSLRGYWYGRTSFFSRTQWHP